MVECHRDFHAIMRLSDVNVLTHAMHAPNFIGTMLFSILSRNLKNSTAVTTRPLHEAHAAQLEAAHSAGHSGLWAVPILTGTRRPFVFCLRSVRESLKREREEVLLNTASEGCVQPYSRAAC